MGIEESREPTLAEVIEGAMDHALSNVRVCLPCKILSYDIAKQTCDLLPMIKQQIVNGDGEEETFDFPVIPDVPVAFPRFGSFYLHAPLASGDKVLCVFSDSSLDQFRANAAVGVPQDPLDLRRHHITDAIALPVSIYGDGAAIAGLPNHLIIGAIAGLAPAHFKANEIALGSENPVEFVALATKVLLQLQALAPVLSTIATDMAAIAAAFTALGVLLPPGASTATAIATLLALPWPGSVASAKVKAD